MVREMGVPLEIVDCICAERCEKKGGKLNPAPVNLVTRDMCIMHTTQTSKQET